MRSRRTGATANRRGRTKAERGKEAILRRLEAQGPLPRRAFTPWERKLLKELVAEGDVLIRRGRYVRREERLLRGRLSVTRQGRAFLTPEGATEDVEILPGQLSGGLHGDVVVARRRGRMAEVVEVVERARERVVGTVEEDEGHLVLRPMEQRLPRFLVEGAANPGDVVVLAIENYGADNTPPVGRVVEVLGRKDAPGVDVLAIVRKFELPAEFPSDVLAEAKALPGEVPPEEIEGRLDLRDEEIFTIDSRDAKDLDDAVSLEVLPDGYRLGVHIADVSHYVPEGSALDREAYRRGTSVYLVDRVLPMFPQELSNGLASLHPGVDRLTLSVFLDFDSAGNPRDFRIVPSVIRSKGRLTYEGVAALLAGKDGEGVDEARRFARTLEEMRTLMEILRGRRIARGAIAFDLPEDKVLLRSDGTPVAVLRRTATVADQIIEEFMVAANEAVASYAARRSLPILYRVHEPPPEDKLTQLKNLLRLLGIRFSRAKTPPPKAFQELLGRMAGRPEERLVATVVLRSMAKAHYAEVNIGHYGLASTHYTHFTSPIRRYPDFLLHRVLKEDLAGRLTPRRRKELLERLAAAAAQTSATETRADEAERESVDLKKVAFMVDKVGEEYEGVITGVMPFGFFVETSLGVEGLVPLASLHDDFYRLDEALFTLRGVRTGRSFRLGQPVRVRVVAARPEERALDLALVEGEEEAAERRRPARRRQSSFDGDRRMRYSKKKPRSKAKPRG